MNKYKLLVLSKNKLISSTHTNDILKQTVLLLLITMILSKSLHQVKTLNPAKMYSITNYIKSKICFSYSAQLYYYYIYVYYIFFNIFKFNTNY